MKILSDNGTKFKNKIFEQVAKELGVVHKVIHTPLPSSFQWQNRRVSCFS